AQTSRSRNLIGSKVDSREIQKSAETALINSAAEISRKNFANETNITGHSLPELVLLYIRESREKKPVEIEKTQVIFHKHICFLCLRSYEEAETRQCQYVHDHPWGKCPQCEDNFWETPIIFFLNALLSPQFNYCAVSYRPSRQKG